MTRSFPRAGRLAIKIGSNLDSLKAQRQLTKIDNGLRSTYERLSSGLRINQASDDAAGLAISEKLLSDSQVFAQAIRNVNDVVSVFNVADSTLSNLSDIVIRQLELATQSANGTFSDLQRAALDKENTALKAEYRRIIETANFNGVNVFDGQQGKINLQVGKDVLSVKTSENNGPTIGFSGTGAYTDDVEALGYVVDEVNHYLVKDFNSDGIEDFIILTLQDRGGGETRLRYKTYLGNSSGAGYSPLSDQYQNLSNSGYAGGGFSVFRAQFGTGNNVEVVADDGNVAEAGTIYINGSGSITGYGAGIGATSNLATTGAASGDFNGDGVSDLVNDINTTSFRIRIQQTTSSTVAGVSAILGSATNNSTTSLSTRSQALTAISTLNGIQDTVLSTRALVGASLARLEVTGRSVEVSKVEYDTAADRIRSADMAKESADLLRLKILQSASTAVLTQANQQPQVALSLLSR